VVRQAEAAAEVGSWRGVEILLDRGARCSVRNHVGQTALDLAKRRGDADVVQLFSRGP